MAMIDKKDIQETRQIAVETIALLHQAEKELRKARNWGIYDILGGGLFASMFKHGKIDKADRLLNNVRLKLSQLQQKLNQVNLPLNAGVNISEIERFIDIAFDNIIADWMVQSKINDNLGQVRDIISDVSNIMSTLDDVGSKQRV